MAKEWYQKKGFKKNPLQVESMFKSPLLGYDLLLDELFYRIEAGNLIFLEGDLGKTAILIKIIEKYKGKGKVAYINCENIKDELNIRTVLANGKKKLDRHIKGFPKNMIILLDNVTNLSEKNSEKIKYYFDQGYILSIIMTGESLIKANIPESIKHRIGNRSYKLRKLTKDEQVDIIMEKINFQDFMTEEQVYNLASKTNNLRELLKECDSALFVMNNEGEEILTESIMQKLHHQKKNDMVS